MPLLRRRRESRRTVRRSFIQISSMIRVKHLPYFALPLLTRETLSRPLPTHRHVYHKYGITPFRDFG
jgi:hypothetical protein